MFKKPLTFMYRCSGAGGVECINLLTSGVLFGQTTAKIDYFVVGAQIHCTRIHTIQSSVVGSKGVVLARII